MSGDAPAPVLEPVLEVERLSVSLPPGADRPLALREVSLTLRAGETLCLVGESGSGKSMLASAVMRLLPPGVAVTSGGVRLRGEIPRLLRHRNGR